MNEPLIELRPRMIAVAYRMLGSVADAEDAVQDAFLRLQVAAEVTSPEGFLVRTTTRRCIDLLRVRRRREKYIRASAPEPVNMNSSRQTESLTASLGQAFLLMLERLTPRERTTYLLRTVFEYEYIEIAKVLGRAESHVRQILRRANSHLLQCKTRFEHTSEEADMLAERFVIACRFGDVDAVEQLFAEDAEACSEGRGDTVSRITVIRARYRALDSWPESSLSTAEAAQRTRQLSTANRDRDYFRRRRRPTLATAG
jgi:RNA polymerase sigma-70 factor, ECF subfamily